jgi:hypothetical protein
MRDLKYSNALWVSPNGSDSNPGTESRPFRTIQRAIDEASTGTAVMVREGVYKESLHIGARSSYWQLDNGSEQRPFTLVSVDGPGKAVIVGDSPTESTILISVGNVRIYDFEIRGVQWRNGDNSPIKITMADRVADAKRDVVIDGNLITGTGRDGVKANMVNDLEITNNTFDMTASEHLIDFVTVWDSKIEHNAFIGRATGAINVKTGSQDIDISNNLIQLEGEFHWPNFSVVEVGGDGFSQLERPPLPSNFRGFEARNVVVEENVITGDNFFTVKFRGAVDSVVQNNVLYGRGPIAVRSERSNSPERDESRNNTIANNVYRDDMQLSSVSSGQGDGLRVYGNRTGDEDDMSFLVGPDRIRSSSVDILDDPYPFWGDYNIVVRAGGTGGSIKPSFDLVIDGQTIGSRTIQNPVRGSFNERDGSNYSNFGFSYQGRTPEDIAIRFDAKYDNSANVSVNLFVDYIEINGERFEAEDFSAVTRFDRPGQVERQWTGIYHDGEMSFDHLYLSPRWPGPNGAASRPADAPTWRAPDPEPQPSPAPEPSGSTSSGSGSQRIDVRVAGVADSAKPEYEVWADGALVGRGVVDGARSGADLWRISDSAFETDTFYFSGADPREVAIVFTKDTGDMAVDYIAVNGARYEAEDDAVYTFSNGNTDYVRENTEEMYHDGAMTFAIGGSGSGGSTASASSSDGSIIVRAAGSGSWSEAPIFEIRADGRSLGRATITNPRDYELNASDRSNFRDYAFDYDGSSPREVTLSLLNDGGSGSRHRDLAVDYIVVDGKRHETEDAVFTSDSGNSWSNSEFIYISGEMTYDLV